MYPSTIDPTNQTWRYFRNTVSDLFVSPMRGALLVIPADETLYPIRLCVCIYISPSTIIPINQTCPYFSNTVSDLFLGPMRRAVLVIH